MQGHTGRQTRVPWTKLQHSGAVSQELHTSAFLLCVEKKEEAAEEGFLLMPMGCPCPQCSLGVLCCHLHKERKVQPLAGALTLSLC